MSRNRQSLRERREELQRRAAAERDQVAAAFAPWQKPLAVVDRGVEFARSTPLISIGLAAGFVALSIRRGRGGVADWIHGGLKVLGIADRLRTFLG